MRRVLFLMLPMSLVLAACAAPAPPAARPTAASGSEIVLAPTGDPGITPTASPNSNAGEGQTRIDEQGAVVVEVTPLNLDAPGGTLEFDVIMNTHSVDLSMDLAALSTLTTDTGLTIPATLWDATPGGHHVSGKLIFSSAQDGKPILEGAGTLTLTIGDVDAPARVFTWEVK